MNAEEPEDSHNILESEDALHVASPACLCGPVYLGRDAAGRRVFEHRQLEPACH